TINNKENIYLFSAYLDKRINNYNIRIIASSYGINLINNKTNNNNYYCHFHFSKEKEKGNGYWSSNIIVEANILWIWQRAWDPRNEFYNNFIITCPKVYNEDYYKDTISSVYISKSNYCILPNSKINFMEITKENLNIPQINENSVIGIKPENIKIAVCTKGLSFLNNSELSSKWIIEWIELQKNFRASSVGIYIYWVPNNVRKILEKMAENKRVDLVNIELPGNSPNQPMSQQNFILRNRQQKRRNELVPLNDCFYRYSSTHHFVLIIDTDELIIPLLHKNWQEMLFYILNDGKWKSEPSSISIRNVYIFNQNLNKNEEKSIFNKYKRSKIVQERDQYGKSFINTRSVVSVFNHFGLHRINSNISNTFHIQANIALKYHWKNKCPNLELGNEICQNVENNLIDDNEIILKNLKEKIKNNIKKYLNI
ncbi:Glycosyltransferase family 92 protein, partial [Meloidogyne graminicola]